VQKATRPDRRPPTTVPTHRQVHDAELVDSMDDFLEEVDALLEENVVEVLRAYVQRGGQ
jgi:ubiquitin-like protein Pup